MSEEISDRGTWVKNYVPKKIKKQYKYKCSFCGEEYQKVHFCEEKKEIFEDGKIRKYK